MRRFIYFIADLQGSPSRERCVQVSGLDYAFPAGEPFETRAVASGVLGNGVLAASGEGGPLELTGRDWFPIRTEIRIDAKERVRVGVPVNRVEWPGPGELARSQRALDGYPVVLGDGNAWTVPVIRFLNGDTQLPRVLTKRDGVAIWSIREKYAELVACANRIVEHLLSGENTAYDPGEMLWFAAAALQVNYRLGEDEIAMMGLIDSENVRAIADSALDGPNLAALLEQFKKKRDEAVAPGTILKIGDAA